MSKTKKTEKKYYILIDDCDDIEQVYDNKVEAVDNAYDEYTILEVTAYNKFKVSTEPTLTPIK